MTLSHGKQAMSGIVFITTQCSCCFIPVFRHHGRRTGTIPVCGPKITAWVHWEDETR